MRRWATDGPLPFGEGPIDADRSAVAATSRDAAGVVEVEDGGTLVAEPTESRGEHWRAEVVGRLEQRRSGCPTGTAAATSRGLAEAVPQLVVAEARADLEGGAGVAQLRRELVPLPSQAPRPHVDAAGHRRPGGAASRPSSSTSRLGRTSPRARTRLAVQR